MSNQEIMIVIAALYLSLVVLLFYGLVVPLIEDHKEIQNWLDQCDKENAKRSNNRSDKQ